MLNENPRGNDKDVGSDKLYRYGFYRKLKKLLNIYKWVITLANELRKNGIDARLDEFITQMGTVNLNRMMIENMMENDCTLVILTDKYAEKANEFKGGVGYETSLLTNNIMVDTRNITPIIRYKGDKNKAIPFYLKGMSYIEFLIIMNLIKVLKN